MANGDPLSAHCGGVGGCCFPGVDRMEQPCHPPAQAFVGRWGRRLHTGSWEESAKLVTLLPGLLPGPAARSWHQGSLRERSGRDGLGCPH